MSIEVNIISYIRSNDRAGVVLHAAESSSFSYALATDDLPMGSSHLIESDGIESDWLMRCDYWEHCKEADAHEEANTHETKNTYKEANLHEEANTHKEKYNRR